MKDGRHLLTADEARSVLSYDPKTGGFCRLKPQGRWPAGAIRSVATKDGYIRVYINGHRYLAHRVAFLLMTGQWPSKLIDHKDGNPSNNRWDNIREATKSENGANIKLRRNTHSGVKGVVKNNNGRWQARITVRRKLVLLGTYDTILEASDAYRAASLKYFGRYSRHAST